MFSNAGIVSSRMQLNNVLPRLHYLLCDVKRKNLLQKIKNRTADITRGTVQKSVCVLSAIPLYGHIQVKMALITHAYFEEGDFTKVGAESLCLAFVLNILSFSSLIYYTMCWLYNLTRQIQQAVCSCASDLGQRR